MQSPNILEIIQHLQRNRNGIVSISFHVAKAGGAAAGNHEMIVFRLGD